MEDALLEQLFGKAAFSERCATTATPPSLWIRAPPMAAVDLEQYHPGSVTSLPNIFHAPAAQVDGATSRVQALGPHPWAGFLGVGAGRPRLQVAVPAQQ